MLGEIKDFNAIEVSNYQEEDITYVADFPVAQHCGFISFLPILIFIFALVLCVMSPGPSQQIIQSEKLSPDLLGIESYVSAVKPMSEYMRIYFRFDEVLNKSLTFKGTVKVVCKKAGKIIHNLKGSINQTTLVASPINWSTPQIEVFRSLIVDYDFISLNILFDSKEKIQEKITLIWESRDPTFVLVFSITKIISASAFLILCIIFMAKSFGSSSHKSTFLQKLTVLLLFFTVFMINPTSVGQIFPYNIFSSRPEIFRDIYFTFFFFYSQVIFSFIGSENEKPDSGRFAQSIILSFILGLVLIIYDILQPSPSLFAIVGSIPPEKPQFTYVHLIVYCLYILSFIVSVFLAYESISQPQLDEQTKEEPHPHTDRINYYLVSTIPFVILYPTFYSLSKFFPFIKGTTLDLMLPVILSIMYALVMDRAHTPINRLQTGYVQVGDDEADEDNPIGVDADPNSLIIQAEPYNDEDDSENDEKSDTNEKEKEQSDVENA